MSFTVSVQRTPRETRVKSGRAKRLLGVAKDVAGVVMQAAVTPHKAALRRLLDMPLTVFGTGIVDWSSYHANTGVGLLVTGVSLYVIEHLISDVEEKIK